MANIYQMRGLWRVFRAVMFKKHYIAQLISFETQGVNASRLFAYYDDEATTIAGWGRIWLGTRAHSFARLWQGQYQYVRGW